MRSLARTSAAASFRSSIVDGLHGSDGVDGGDLGPALADVLDHHVARQHGADLVLDLQRQKGERRIAGAQNVIIAELDAQLCLECAFHIDFGDDSETLLLKRVARPLQGFVEPDRQGLGEIVAHRCPFRGA